MKNQKKFKITPEFRKQMLELISTLPEIPYLIPNPKAGEPVAQIIKHTIRKSGAQIILENPEAKSDGKELDPTRMYTQVGEIVRMQNHKVAMFAAFEKYGEPAIQTYCDEVWDYHYSIKTLPEEPQELILTDK